MRNRQFNLLEIIAILLVILGHIGDVPGATLANGIFPIYGYHMALFIFVSGYFFKRVEHIPDFFHLIWKKFKRLIFPLLAWNVVYAGVVEILRRRQVTDYFADLPNCFTIQRLLVSPFLSGDQYYLNLAGWFVVCLFFTQIVYGLISIFENKIPLWTTTVFLLIFGGLGVHYAGVYDSNIFTCNLFRTLFALPFFHFGYCYKKIEHYIDKIPSYIYFSVWAILLFVFFRFGCSMHPYSYVLVYNNYGDACWRPFVSSFLGIMFWTRFAQIMADLIRHTKLEDYIASNTWCIMIHHLTVMFLISWVGVRFCSPCNADLFRTSFWGLQPCFSYWLYAILMLVLPLCFQYLLNLCKLKNYRR